MGPVENWPQTLKTALGILYHSRHPMFIWWGPDLIQFYNDAYVPSFGIGKHPLALGQKGRVCWPEIWPIIYPQIESVLKEKKASWNENQLVPIFRNGKIEEVYWTYGYSPIFSEDGSVGGVLVVCTETTQQVFAQRKLEAEAVEAQKSHKALENYFMQSPVPFVILEGADHFFKIANPPYELMVGRKVMGKTVREAFTKGEADLYLSVLDEVYKTGRPFIGKELPFSPIDDHGIKKTYYLDFAYHANRNEAGQIVGILVVAYDVTEQVLNRKKLELSESLVKAEKQKFETIFYDSPAGMAVLYGPDFVYEKVNSKYIDIIGRNPVGKKLVDALPELEGQPFFNLMKNVFDTGIPHIGKETEVHLNSSNGSETEIFYLNFIYSRILDGEGNPYGVFIHVIDMTENVMSRKAVQTSRNKADELLVELQNALIARDDFLSIASHELKTPITSLKMQLQMTARGIHPEKNITPAPEKLSQVVRVSLKQVDRLSALIDDLLDISRIESGKLTFNFVEVEVGQLVEEIIERFAEECSAANCSIKYIRINDTIIMADPYRLDQVLTNLLSNAIKYGSNNNIEVSVDSSDEKTFIAVRDYGLGIDQSKQHKVFERFERAIDSNQISGLGLGLYISKTIVEAHHGEIHLESELGKGSTFTVELPIRH